MEDGEIGVTIRVGDTDLAGLEIYLPTISVMTALRYAQAVEEGDTEHEAYLEVQAAIEEAYRHSSDEWGLRDQAALVAQLNRGDG